MRAPQESLPLGPATTVNEPITASSTRNPWLWVPSLYFAQGIPYVVVMTVAVIMFKRLGVGNKEIALYTSWLYLPYVIKPAWSPLVQRFGTRRGWVILTQLLVGAGLGCAALAIPADDFVRYTLAALTLVAISSATHDVAADGFYLLALSSHQQAWFVGIRSTAYRMAMIVGQGLLVMLAGLLESATGLPPVTIDIRASMGLTQALVTEPTNMAVPSDTDSQRIIVARTSYELSTYGRQAADILSAMEQVRAWNIAQGFYAAPTESTSSESAPDGSLPREKAGWLVSLEEAIRRWFGPTERAVTAGDEQAGDVAIVWMRLAKPITSDDHLIVQFGLDGGDPSFQVIEGERFAVTANNWNQPFAAVVQVDPKLDRASSATFEVRSGNLTLAWSATFFIVAAFFLLLCAYHWFAMPRPATDGPVVGSEQTSLVESFVQPFIAFFDKPQIWVTLAFLFLYRLPEAQLVKLATPLLLDAREEGGLSLTTGEVGFVYGTVGVFLLTLGGILGGFVAARDGLRRWLIPMALMINLPNLAYMYLAYAQPENIWLVTTAVGVEQFGYGFGFTAYLLYCIYVSRGEHQTVHYALCTGIMALGMMIPGMWSGWLEELIGYRHFFVWVMISTIVSFAVTFLVEVDSEFGKKTDVEADSGDTA